MIRALLVAAMLVTASPAFADTDDYLGTFPDQATAQADPVWSKFYIAPSADGPGGWRSDECFTPQVFDGTLDGNGNLVPLPGFFLWCTEPLKDDALLASPALVIAADRDMANAGNPNFIIFTGLTPAQMDADTISPTPLGSNYPFGQAP